MLKSYPKSALTFGISISHLQKPIISGLFFKDSNEYNSYNITIFEFWMFTNLPPVSIEIGP
jgi:hypothetical protein